MTLDPLSDLLGESPPIAALRDRLRRLVTVWGAGRRSPPLLLLGETGTGKGLLARALHRASARADGPFIAINCAAVPASLLEAEFFGFERGAFTDARQPKPGLLESAHGGTLFLDEIGLLPAPLQAKLLTFLDDHHVRRLGSTRSVAVDVWLMAATNSDLEAAARNHEFRADLFHRLAVVPFRLPPLREREQDVLLLANAFLSRATADYGLPRKTLTEAARRGLQAHDWPGNVRELANTIERAALLTDQSSIGAEHLELPLASADGRPGVTPVVASVVPESPAETTSIRRSVEQYERRRLLESLERANWNTSKAADELGIPRTTLRYRMTKYGLQPSSSAGPHASRPGSPPGAAAETPEPDVPAHTPREVRITALRVRVTVSPSPGEGPAWQLGQGLDLVADKVQAFGGAVIARRVAELDAAFGLEPAEDAPSRAANAALAIQKRAERLRSEQGGFSVLMALDIATCQLTGVDGAVAPALESRREIDRALEDLLKQVGTRHHRRERGHGRPPSATIHTRASGGDWACAHLMGGGGPP